MKSTMKIGSVNTEGIEGVVTRISKTSVRKDWFTTSQRRRAPVNETVRESFARVKKRESLLPKRVRDKITFVVPYRIYDRTNKVKTFSKYIEGSFPNLPQMEELARLLRGSGFSDLHDENFIMDGKGHFHCIDPYAEL